MHGIVIHMQILRLWNTIILHSIFNVFVFSMASRWLAHDIHLVIIHIWGYNIWLTRLINPRLTLSWHIDNH